MAQLSLIDTSSFELIRDRIAQVILDEYANQYSLDNTLPNITEVNLERFVNFDKHELPAINVYFMGGPIQKENIKKQVAEYKYAVDCYANAKSTNSNRADKAARIKVQKILRIVRAVLDDQYYRTLLFPSPFVIRTNVDEIIMNLNKDEDSKNTAIGRIVFTVEAYESSQVDDTTPLELVETQALLYDTEKGYKWVLERGNTPNAPILSGTANSSTENELSWTTVADADEYKIYKNGFFLTTVSGTTYTDTTSNEVDYYQVTALDGNLESEKSNLLYLYFKGCLPVVYQNSDQSFSVSIAQNETPYTSPDIDIDINGNNEGTVPSNKDFDINVTYPNGDPVILDSVTIVSANPDNKVGVTLEVPDCPSISVEISGDATPDQFTATTYTANLTGANGASSNPSDYSFMWIVKKSGVTVFAQGAISDNTMDIALDSSGDHTIEVTVTENAASGISATNDYSVTVVATDLLLNLFPNSNDVYVSLFKKVNANYNGNMMEIRNLSNGQTKEIGYDIIDPDIAEINSFRGGVSEVSLVLRKNEVTLGADFVADTIDAEYLLTDGSGNLNLDSDGNLFLRPIDNPSGAMRFDGISGAVEGTVIYIGQMPENDSTSQLMMYRSPWIQKLTGDDSFRVGKGGFSPAINTKILNLPGIAGTDRILFLYMNTGGSDTKFYISSSLEMSEPFSDFNYQSNDAYVGARVGSSSDTRVRIYGAVIYDKENLETDKTAMETYLKTLYPKLP